jgi:cytochrome bd-type quinol oxidase subunit 1
MSDLLAAHSQMAVSLGFHIVFAVIGIAMPVVMVVAEGRVRDAGGRRLLASAIVTLLVPHLQDVAGRSVRQATAGE